jgi:hypothetical protein
MKTSYFALIAILPERKISAAVKGGSEATLDGALLAVP